MVRLSVYVVALFFPVCLLLVSVSTTLGGMQRQHPSLSGFGSVNCRGWGPDCWFGLYLNVPRQDAHTILTQRGYREQFIGYDYYYPSGGYCQVSIGYDPSVNGAYGYNLHDCDFVLGDLLDRFGDPIAVDAQDNRYTTLYMDTRMRVTVMSPAVPLSRIIDLEVSFNVYCLNNQLETIWHGFVAIGATANWGTYRRDVWTEVSMSGRLFRVKVSA
ncbi:MAG: hypothetical protein U0694_04380 [Anaerolineae bacterium]